MFNSDQKKIISQVIIIGIFLLILSAECSEIRFLSSNDALQISLKENLRIRTASTSIPISEANLIIAKYRPNPIIISNAEIVKGGSLHPIQVGAQIEVGKKRYWRMQVAKEEISRTKLEVEKIIWEIRTEVKIAYADMSVKKEYLELAKTRVAFLSLLLSCVEKQQKNKTGIKSDFERVNVESLRVKNVLNEKIEELADSQLNFNHLMHKDLKSTFDVLPAKELQPKIEISKYPNLDKLIEKALEKRIEIGILEKEYGIVRAELNRAKSERIPNVYFEAGPVKPSLGTNIWGPYIGGYTEVPLFNRKQGEIKGTFATQDLLEIQKEKIKEDITVEVIKSYRQLLLSEEILKTFQNEINNHSENLTNKVLDDYEKGLLTLSDVLDAEERNRDIDEEYLESILEYQIALARLEYSIGMPIFEL